ncbi:hypothetical protein [Methylobacterium pseudosasicola]|uniref:Uncharacterized protein n=1 Tax=Methylobacterium pseudosasicola TaxID=582667 RepID=A0A1I4PT65_9HYPH|nr:hypothetical protein [Methylobacterium pseudosasicola]SFM30944.1 hypothetical protein SAMN05192568_102647 [Methylobacterium pseudosasicola]
MADTLMDMVRAERATLEADRVGTVDERLSRVNARFRVACTGVTANVHALGRILRLRELEIHVTTMDAPVGWPATWVEWELACILSQALGHGPHTSAYVTPKFTGSLEAARSFVAGTLPGFWVSSGLCALTGHASIGADYNGPDGERLHREWPTDRTPCDWSEDLPPGDGPHIEAMAILACAVRALAHKLQLEASA